MKKLGPDSMNREGVLDAINDWLQTKLEAGNKTAADTAECMRVFAHTDTHLRGMLAHVTNLFTNTEGTIDLLTGHKAKGMEWDTVYFLDEYLVGTDTEQEQNLRYVIMTRAKEKLIYIDGRDLR